MEKTNTKKIVLRIVHTALCVLLAVFELRANGGSEYQEPPVNKASEMNLQHNEWRGLVPLHSTRADVERLLGPPKLSHGFTDIYQTGDERADVLYSAGSCKMSGVERWNVPANTVLKIMITPKATLLVRDLHLSSRKYARTQDSHPEDWVHYLDLDDGIVIDALINNGCEKVISITYQPSSQDSKLHCD